MEQLRHSPTPAQLRAAPRRTWNSAQPIYGWAGIAWQEDALDGAVTRVELDDPDRFVEVFGQPATDERAAEMLRAHAADIPFQVYLDAEEDWSEVLRYEGRDE